MHQNPQLIITNYPEDKTETFEVENNPNRPEDGTRTVTFSRELFIEQDDFMEEPVKGYFRMFPGNEVRLKTTYIVKCTGCKKDENGNVIEVYAEYDPETRGGNAPDGRKIKGTIHWVDAKTASTAEVRLYDNLFTVPDPDNIRVVTADKSVDTTYYAYMRYHQDQSWLSQQGDTIMKKIEKMFPKSNNEFKGNTSKSQFNPYFLSKKLLS